jgi:general secretion pathway protein H
VAARGSTGFTLIELLVVLAVIALAATLAVPALASLTGADARRSAAELAGSMRALFEIAGLRHATCRMTLDLDASSWEAECARGRAGVARDEDARDLAERFPAEPDEEVRRLLAATEFHALDDRLVGKRELPGGARFGPVAIEGRRSPVESGKAHVYFFPGGRAQAARVPVVDGGFRYTVVLEPLTGRTRLVAGEVSE